MWRDSDPRSVEQERPQLGRGAGGASGPRSRDTDPREVFARDLNLPRGSARQRIRVREQTYELRGSEARTLATVGAFRVVPANDLRDQHDRPLGGRASDLRHLRESGLIRTMPYMVNRTRTTLVTLTDRGRDVLETMRRHLDREPVQTFHSGIAKPRELAHDTQLYRAYLRASERLVGRGGRIRRVVLEDELKRDYQRFLQASNRGRRDSRGRPDREREEIERWAHLHDLPVVDGHVQFPDVRIEVEERDGRRTIEDIEVETPHYRGAHAAAKARSGFTRFRAVGARLGGGQSGRGGAPFDPHAAEELVP